MKEPGLTEWVETCRWIAKKKQLHINSTVAMAGLLVTGAGSAGTGTSLLKLRKQLPIHKTKRV
jgi:hypothetical protein